MEQYSIIRYGHTIRVKGEMARMDGALKDTESTIHDPSGELVWTGSHTWSDIARNDAMAWLEEHVRDSDEEHWTLTNLDVDEDDGE